VDILTSLSGTWWGSHSLLLKLYRSIFRGSIEYGCQIFRFHRTKSIFIKLKRLQFQAIRVAMGYRISTPINIILFEAREVSLKFRFNLLTRKFLFKSLAREFNPIIESLDSLRLATIHKNTRIHLLRSFLIFKHYICIIHYRNIIHSSLFLPNFFYDLDNTSFAIRFCMDMLPIDRNLSNAAILSKFPEKSLQYRNNVISFYMDGSKLSKDTPSGVGVFSSDLDLCITYKLLIETSIFTAEAWAILFS